MNLYGRSNPSVQNASLIDIAKPTCFGCQHARTYIHHEQVSEVVRSSFLLLLPLFRSISSLLPLRANTDERFLRYQTGRCVDLSQLWPTGTSLILHAFYHYCTCFDVKTSSKIFRTFDGLILLSKEAYEQEAIDHIIQWQKGLSKESYTLVPLIPTESDPSVDGEMKTGITEDRLGVMVLVQCYM